MKLQPDLSWWEDGRCLWIGDANYKRAEAKGYPNADIYQALAYCQGTGLRRATLIYAEGVADVRRIEVRESDVVLEVRSLDLSGTPERVLTSIKNLARNARRDL